VLIVDLSVLVKNRQADAIAARFGAADCTRFGMGR
jgi:hypothetical protein